jgi:hypothetical protein
MNRRAILSPTLPTTDTTRLETGSERARTHTASTTYILTRDLLADSPNSYRVRFWWVPDTDAEPQLATGGLEAEIVARPRRFCPGNSHYGHTRGVPVLPVCV